MVADYDSAPCSRNRRRADGTAGLVLDRSGVMRGSVGRIFDQCSEPCHGIDEGKKLFSFKMERHRTVREMKLPTFAQHQLGSCVTVHRSIHRMSPL